MPSNKPEPRGLRIAKGNPSKRPLPPPDETKRGSPAKPCDLSPEVSAKWDELIVNITETGCIYVTDGDGIRELAEAIVAVRQARKDIGDQFIVPCGTDGQDTKPNPLWRIVNDEGKTMIRLLTEFGLTPTARVRLVGLQPKEKTDPIGAFRDKVRANAAV